MNSYYTQPLPHVWVYSTRVVHSRSCIFFSYSTLSNYLLGSRFIPSFVGTDTVPDQKKKKKGKQPFIHDFDVKSVYVAKAINTIVSIAFPSLLDLSVWHSCNQAPSLYTEGERDELYCTSYRPCIFHPHQTRSGEMMKRRGQEQRGCKWQKGFPLGYKYISKRHRAVTQLPFLRLFVVGPIHTHICTRHNLDICIPDDS